MARVLTFSRVYPSYHPKAGQPTYFVEKIWRSLIDQGLIKGHQRWDNEIENYNWNYAHFDDCKAFMPKGHTIRAGHRWKAGDWFSPRVWSGKPYKSKMIQFAPDIQVKKTWDFDIEGTDFFLDGKHQFALIGEAFDFDLLAKNDGLSNHDLFDWFCLSPDFEKTGEFHGQIICWNENIEY